MNKKNIKQELEKAFYHLGLSHGNFKNISKKLLKDDVKWGWPNRMIDDNYRKLKNSLDYIVENIKDK